MQTYEYDSLVEGLQQKVANVVFTKADGTLRKMRCTLMTSFLPEQKDVEEYTARMNKTAVPVWDLEHKGWRSFRLDSIQELNWE